jgi:hypothetical protein
MTRDHHEPTEPPAADKTPARRWSVSVAVLALLLVVGVLSTSLLSACLRRGPDDVPAASGGASAQLSAKGLPQDLFRDWPAAPRKPDVAIVLSGQQHSYLKFCGCSTPQLGGFERRYNFMELLRQRGWPVVAADLGDLVEFKTGLHSQALLKYETAMNALEALHYVAIALGEDDYNLPLLDGLSLFTLQKPNAFPRVLAANLSAQVRMQMFPLDGQRSMIGSWQAAGGKDNVPLVGIAGLTGRSAIKNIQNPVIANAFDIESAKVLGEVLKKMEADKVEFRVLLYQGNYFDAKVCAQQFPQLDVILCLSNEDTPPAQADTVGRTMIVQVGHRGRYIGVVGAYRTGNPAKPFELYYQRVEMGEEYETTPGKEKDHPILRILDNYAQEVKRQQFLENSPQKKIPTLPNLGNAKLAYVGSDTCANCHKAEYAKWVASKHAHAFDALVNVANKPKLRQFDPECVQCHTIGFGFESGYVAEVGKRRTPHLKNVGCENCHGPGSAHVQLPNDQRFRMAMSPWKTKPDDLLPTIDTLRKGYDGLPKDKQALLNRVNDMCQKCHDIDNDPHYKFEKNWPDVVHGRNAPK